MYAILSTRPDVSYALSIMSIYQANPGEQHWAAVKITFLNGNLVEEVYMTQPEGFSSKDDHNKVCKLK